MKIIFFGTPQYCVPILESLAKNFKEGFKNDVISAVVTQKPSPKGRKKFISYSPVDTWAHKRGIPVLFDPEEIIKENIPGTLGILVAYGKIIPDKVINYFPAGILNIHPSLLPKHRGASPLQATLALGEKESGATIIKIDKLMDHGPIVANFKTEVLANETCSLLTNRIFKQATDVLVETIPFYLKGKIKPKVQDETNASYTTLLKRESGFIKPELLVAALDGQYQNLTWEIPFIKDHQHKFGPSDIPNLFRALESWPGIWTTVKVGSEQKRLKLIDLHLDQDKLVIDRVQLEGKNVVTWNEFQMGYPNFEFI